MFREGLSPFYLLWHTQQIIRTVSWQPEGFQNPSGTKQKIQPRRGNWFGEVLYNTEVNRRKACALIWLSMISTANRKTKATVQQLKTRRLLQQNYLYMNWQPSFSVIKWDSLHIFPILQNTVFSFSPVLNHSLLFLHCSLAPSCGRKGVEVEINIMMKVSNNKNKTKNKNTFHNTVLYMFWERF